MVDDTPVTPSLALPWPRPTAQPRAAGAGRPRAAGHPPAWPDRVDAA